MNKDIVRQVFPQAVANFEKGLCSICGKKVKVTEFRGSLSRKEYKISGMCQKCQDNIFGKGGE